MTSLGNKIYENKYQSLGEFKENNDELLEGYKLLILFF